MCQANLILLESLETWYSPQKLKEEEMEKEEKIIKCKASSHFIWSLCCTVLYAQNTRRSTNIFTKMWWLISWIAFIFHHHKKEKKQQKLDYEKWRSPTLSSHFVRIYTKFPLNLMLPNSLPPPPLHAVYVLICIFSISCGKLQMGSM